jgi:hypothetical protein
LRGEGLKKLLRRPISWIILISVSIVVFLAAGPTIYDPGEGVIAVDIVNDTSVPVSMAICTDTDCRHIAEKLDLVEPGSYFPQNAGPYGREFLAVAIKRSNGRILGSAVPGAPFRCVRLDVGPEVKDSYMLTSLVPCGS